MEKHILIPKRFAEGLAVIVEARAVDLDCLEEEEPVLAALRSPAMFTSEGMRWEDWENDLTRCACHTPRCGRNCMQPLDVDLSEDDMDCGGDCGDCGGGLQNEIDALAARNAIADAADKLCLPADVLIRAAGY